MEQTWNSGYTRGEIRFLGVSIPYRPIKPVLALSKMFNLISDSGFVLDEWLEGSIRPIYRNKDGPTLLKTVDPLHCLAALVHVLRVMYASA
jgi:hypothetical protein